MEENDFVKKNACFRKVLEDTDHSLEILELFII